MTKLEQENLKAALTKAIDVVESTISWVEARGWTNEQDFLNFEDRLNNLSCKDHKIEFFKYKHMD